MAEARFAGQTAVITGGASGIGLGTAKRLKAEGARVMLWDVSPQNLEKAKAELGPGVESEVVDVTDYDSVARAPRRAAPSSGGSTSWWRVPGSPGPMHRPGSIRSRRGGG